MSAGGPAAAHGPMIDPTHDSQPNRMRATPTARALAFLVNMLDRFRGPLVVVIVAIEVFVFAPRQMTMQMIWCGIIGAAVAVAWLLGYEP